MINPSEIFMMIVGAAMALSGIPQALRLLSRRSAADVSLAMFWVLFLGQSCWVWYGIRMQSPSIILMNTAALLVNASIIFLAIRFRNNQRQ